MNDAQATTDGWFRSLAWPVGLFAISRAGLFLLVYLSSIYLPTNPSLPDSSHLPGNNLLNGWIRWDGSWYVDIAENGYSQQPKLEEQKNVVFFPLYPTLVRVLNTVTGKSALSGILISNAAFGLALVLLFKLCSQRYGPFVGRWTLILLATFPFSFYFSAMYSEALFLLMIAGTFYFGDREQWALAALFAAGASATRGVGIVATAGLVVLYMSKIDFQVRRVRRDVLWLALGCSGLALYTSFLWYKFGDPLLFVSSRDVFGWEQGMGLEMAWETIQGSLSIKGLLSGQYPALNLMHIGITATGLLLVGLAWRKLELAHSIWAILAISLSFMGGWHGMGRYILPVFPVFAAIPLLVQNPRVLSGLAYTNTLLLALFTIMYSHWFWVS